MARFPLVFASLSVVVVAPACFQVDPSPFGNASLGPATSTSDDDASATLGMTSSDTLDGTAGATSSTTGVDPTLTATTTVDSSSSSSSSGSEPEVCGDGLVVGAEDCDDANLDPGDGCSDACEVEPGFECTGEPSLCVTVCGDGVVSPGEACDDANGVPNDGCSGCAVDPGYQCAGEPSVCLAAGCGDGVLQGGEGCDDGGVLGGDGCSASCAVELYYRCVGAGAGSCAPIRIGYIPADGNDPVFTGAISAITGGPVTYTDAGASTPTLVTLQASYDCVFTHPNFTYADSLTFGNTLASFVDGGGNVVLGIATDFAPPTGLSTSMIMQVGYSPITTAGGVTYGPTATYAANGVTLIHSGVLTYTAPIFDTGVALQGTGITDGTYDNGSIAAAYRPDFKVVYLNGTGNTSFGPTGDWPRLVANACAVGFL